jgi:hypothetical protein
MTVKAVPAPRKPLGDEARRKHNTRYGAPAIQSDVAHAALRKRAIAIDETIGLYKDCPASKNGTPPYVPVWVEFMVKRKA